MNFKKIFLMISAAAALALSCDTIEAVLKLYTESVSFKAAGGEETIALTANYDWAAVVDGEAENWISISNGLGEASGKPQSFTITVAENKGAARSASVTVAMLGVAPQKVTVSQEGVPGAVTPDDGSGSGSGEGGSGDGSDDPGNTPGGNEPEPDDTKYLYLSPWEWVSDSPRIEAYFFGDKGNVWVTMEPYGDLYKCAVPEGYTNVIFVRMDPAKPEGSFDSKWNQTEDLVLPTDGKNCFTINSWDGGAEGKSKGSWSTYTPQN